MALLLERSSRTARPPRPDSPFMTSSPGWQVNPSAHRPISPGKSPPTNPVNKSISNVIHKGKPAGVDVTLGTRPDEIAGMEPMPLDQLNLDGIPRDLADRVRGAIEGNLGGMDLRFGDGALQAAPKMEDAMREMKLRVEKAMEGLGGFELPEEGGINVQQGASIRLMDEQGSIELKSNDGGKEVTLRDKQNKIVWTGPWDTEQDKAAAPDDVRKRVERLNFDSKFNGNGLRLRGGLRMPDDEPGGDEPE